MTFLTRKPSTQVDATIPPAFKGPLLVKFWERDLWPCLSQPISTHSTAPSYWPRTSTIRSASTHPPTGPSLNTSSSILTGSISISHPSRSVVYCSELVIDKDTGVITKLHCSLSSVYSFKATWHPVYDLIVAGRYPDDRVCPGDEKTVDIYDSNTAELVFQLQDPTGSGIKSVSTVCFKYSNIPKLVWFPAAQEQQHLLSAFFSKKT